MAEIKNFSLYTAQKDVDIVLSESEETIRKMFPKKFIDPKFHNNIIIYLLGLREKILDAGDPATPETFKLRNLRKHIYNEYTSEANQAKDCLSDYKVYITEEFMDANNGEDLGEHLAQPEVLNNFELLLRDYTGTPRLNQVLEKIYLDSHDAEDIIRYEGIEVFYEELQKTIQVLQTAFPPYLLDYKDATALLARLTILNLETVINGGEIVSNIVHSTEFIKENHHRVVRIPKKEIKDLYEMFNSVFDELPEFDDKENQDVLEFSINRFKRNLFLLKHRHDNCPFDKVPVHTRELENTMLMSIITYAPYLAVPFIKFLLDNKIRLPLSAYKYGLYPSYFIDYDNETIQNAFIFELEDSMVNMDEFRKHVLNPTELEDKQKSLIHIEREKPRHRRVKKQQTPEKTQ